MSAFPHSHPPPPPPPAGPHDPQSSYRTQRQQRLPQAPPSIVTNVAASARAGGPATAIEWTSSPPLMPATTSLARSQSSVTSSPRPLQTGMNSYNPQEWVRAGQVVGGNGAGGSYMAHTAMQPRGTTQYTGMEANMPEPPPPYSASSPSSATNSRAANSSPFSSTYGQTTSSSPSPQDGPIQTPVSTSRTSNLSTYPVQSPPTSFPPPPSSHRDRSGSRTRGVLNTISAFASRQRPTDYASPIDSTQYNRQRNVSGFRENNTSPPSSFVAPPATQSPAPPGGRRSSSAGVGPSQTRNPVRDRQTSNWQHGQPLPPPPPGGPPSSRSQSVDRMAGHEREGYVQIVQAPTPIRFHGTSLGPVPPTPADWLEEQSAERANSAMGSDGGRVPLRLQTTPNRELAQESSSTAVETVAPGTDAQATTYDASPASGGLRRLPAVRDPSAKGIRERRMEARARHGEPQTAIEPTTSNPWAEAKPANLTISSNSYKDLAVKKNVTKSSASPRTFAFNHTPNSANATPASAKSNSSEMEERKHRQTRSLSAMTPPFSPESEEIQRRRIDAYNRKVVPTAALPTPPHHDSSAMHSSKSLVANEQPRDVEVGRVTPPSAGLSSSKSAKGSISSQMLPTFYQASLARYQALLELEAAAPNDAERLEHFAKFFVNESRLRRDLYSRAFSEMGSDVLDLTRDLWRSNESVKRSNMVTPLVTTTDSTSEEAEILTMSPADVLSASSQGSLPFTPMTEQESPMSASDNGHLSREDYKRANGFKPALSPILSMAQSVVTGDEEDSRGRAPSRWWETSNSGDSVANGGRKIERSKRESKYMGFSRQTLESLQWESEDSPALSQGTPGPSSYAHLGPNDYPPEKVGFYDEVTPSARATFQHDLRTPQVQKLDVSRLITIPPPYPRHYPAVNNKHPELASLRAQLRHVSETPEKAHLRAQFALERADAHIDPESITQRRRSALRGIQQQVSEGKMSFADAARAETGIDESELKHFKALSKNNFNLFTKNVFQPLSTLLEEKMITATGSIDLLRASLLDSAATQDPNTMQESGDELPELLEKATLMKWFFEARETLHKDMFELQSESDELYKQVMITPYLVTSNQAKASEVEAFFAKDGQDRAISYAREALGRSEQFHSTIDEAVNKGAEAQLSAFWDIAPPLLEVVDKVPEDTERLPAFDIQIPAAEVEENPSYLQHPMQYLFTLLAHAEKSSYQFIESQTNLFCLLHEANLGLMSARVKHLQLQREHDIATQGQDGPQMIEEEMNSIRVREDERLTKELKDRVQVIEEQWKSALGTSLSGCRQRVGDWLVRVGAWDDSLEE